MDRKEDWEARVTEQADIEGILKETNRALQGIINENLSRWKREQVLESTLW